jgi:hypothetical protein
VALSQGKLSVISANAGESRRIVFETLTREHLARLYAFALRLTGERTAADGSASALGSMRLSAAGVVTGILCGSGRS